MAINKLNIGLIANTATDIAEFTSVYNAVGNIQN